LNYENFEIIVQWLRFFGGLGFRRGRTMSPPTLSSMARHTARGNARDFLTLE
jgi:hypothetical protein